MMIFRTDSYDAEIAAAAKKYNVPQQLIKQVITVESGFNPTAASGTGPVGLMQISKALAKDYGYDEKDRLDPAKNIEMGAKYLRQNLDAFGGDVSKALLGYNQGTGGARQMLAGKIPMAEEGRKYMNNPAFTSSLDPNIYLKPSVQGGVDSSSDYLKTNSASYATPAQAGAAAENSGLSATASLLNMGQAGMNNKESTIGASKFTPAMLTKQGQQAAQEAPNAAVAPAAPSALGTVPSNGKEGFGADKMQALMGGLATLGSMFNKKEEQVQYAPTPQVGGRSAPYRAQPTMAGQLVNRTFQQMYYNPTGGQ